MAKRGKGKKRSPGRPRPDRAAPARGGGQATEAAASGGDVTGSAEAEAAAPPALELGPAGRLLARLSPRQRAWALPLLALASGVVWFLGAPKFDLWPLGWVAMIPGLLAIEAAPTTRRAVLYGWLTGLVANAGGFYWITSLLTRFGHLPAPLGILGLLLLAGYQGVVFLLFALAVRQVRLRSRARRGTPLPMILIAPVLMVAFESLVPFIFPWYLAITQAWVTPVIQVAELTGPVGVTALLLIVNGALYDALTTTSRRRRVATPALAAGIVAVALVFGVIRIHQVEATRASAPHIHVGLVQGNIPFDEKGYKRRDLAPRQLANLQEVSADLERQGADLVVWSESSYPFGIPRDQKEDFPPRAVGRVRRGFTVPLVFGAITEPSDPDTPPFNSALYLDREGRFAGRFDKIFLLVFGEYIPLYQQLPWLRKILPRNVGQLSRGKKVTTFPFTVKGQTYQLGPLICYEDILPELTRRLARLHPDLLVNITNDAWFGDTSEPWEHLALSVFRAVETRTDLVRSVNTGVSAFVDSTGKVIGKSYAVDPKKTPVPMTGHLGEVALVEGGHTVYAAVGNLFGWAVTAWALFLWLAGPIVERVRRRRGGATS